MKSVHVRSIALLLFAITITVNASSKIILVAASTNRFELARQVLREAGFEVDFGTGEDQAALLFMSDTALPPRYQVTRAPLKSAAKVQQLSLPLFKDLRLYSPAAALLDLAEGAFDRARLVPNDLKQEPIEAGQKEFPGFRMILGETQGRRTAVVLAESFTDAALALAEPAHDNREILLRLGRWLSSEPTAD